MTAERLLRRLHAELKRLDGEATPGPWIADNAFRTFRIGHVTHHVRTYFRDYILIASLRNNLKTLLSALELAQQVERGFMLLEMSGVPRERAKTVANGIDVLSTRLNREVGDVRAENASLKLQLAELQAGMHGYIADVHSAKAALREVIHAQGEQFKLREAAEAQVKALQQQLAAKGRELAEAKQFKRTH